MSTCLPDFASAWLSGQGSGGISSEGLAELLKTAQNLLVLHPLMLQIK